MKPGSLLVTRKNIISKPNDRETALHPHSPTTAVTFARFGEENKQLVDDLYQMQLVEG
jgi:hypothetical protein